MVKYLSRPFVLSTFLCIFLFYSGIVKPSDRIKYSSLIPKSQLTEITGIIKNSPSKTSSGKSYTCTFELQAGKNNILSCSTQGNLKLLIPSELVEVYFPGKLYSSSNNKGAFLYEAGGLYTVRGSYNPATNFFVVTSCIFNQWPSTFFGKLDFFRAKCRLQFKRLMFSWGEGGGLLLALLCGAREYTSEETKIAFKNAGLSHILALSGMHLSMFSAIAVFFGNKLGRKKTTFIIRVIALIIFVWFAGFSPSLLRAFICSMLIILSSMISSSEPDMIMILCFSFLLQVIISPSDILNTGFMLSYGALAGILITNNLFRHFYDKLFPISISSSLSASTGAQIFTAPISLKLFGSFSPIGIVATTVISPMVTVFIYSGLVLIILSLIFPFISGYSGILLNFQYNLIKTGVKIFAYAPRIQL